MINTNCKNKKCEECEIIANKINVCNGDKYTKNVIFVSSIRNTPYAILYRGWIVYSKSFMEYWIINALNKEYWRIM